MKFKSRALIAAILLGLSYSCFEDNDDNGILASSINDFVWKGMNAYYLYKDNVPDLANDRFGSDDAYATYLNTFMNPEDIFESLIYNRPSIDKYSWITNDYIAQELSFAGVSLSHGMEFNLHRSSQNPTDLFGVVRLILPNSDAEGVNLKRGNYFYAVDGTPLNESNWRALLSQDSFELNMATYDDNGTPEPEDDTIVPNNEDIPLTKVAYEENPIFKTEIIQAGGKKIGYLMYNRFTPQFDQQLNAAFGNLAINNIDELVLDLRYNPGGDLNTAILLSSMITGQLTGEIHSTSEYNSEYQDFINSQDPELLINRFVDNDAGTPLNSLNLNKVYILATGSSASASELVINSLRPHIQVIQIGTTTVGKYQGSLTLYDSPNFRRDGANPNHTYAMQPLILKLKNADGFTDFDDGLIPNIVLKENAQFYGVLGEITEPLLARAIQHITTGSDISGDAFSDGSITEIIGSSYDLISHPPVILIDNESSINFLNKLRQK